jgi:hypothetical protein
MYHVKILLGYFTGEVGRENGFKPTLRDENLYEASNHKTE